MSDEALIIRREGNLAWIGFNRPESRNAMTWEMYDALEDCCDTLAEDDDVVAVVLHGVGGEAFVAGTDITQFKDFDTPEDAIGYERRIDRVVGKLEVFPKPTIAMIEGACVGGGAALALVCDFRYCTPTMKFGVPIAKTLGNTLSMTNVSRLVDMIGVARTKEALMMAKLFNAEEAYRIGLVNEVFEADAIVDEVAGIAATFGRRAPLTVQASKALVGRVLAERRADPEAGDDWVTTCYMSRDFKAAVNKFVNKTPFEWTGE
ncbi:enoyl-CoA hydratase/isomerase family protein [Aidingimonas halophila]|uniref:Enoyl-CoA hydratase/carnithine racemase n=1 Tax=Aidingimonas halophila TaxID=574349 RepID=A0A1H2X4A1_9GAMM|nr:enoyl-CoA hydratase/isomerase family protein [Aidingimonas halophila]GHC28087.1 enoyl-CoA hydratase [Aidingimonas halophila]SDW87712.1 Enoyl-CoA hydratase/carnithine racemase [Aidingimonas halophila]